LPVYSVLSRNICRLSTIYGIGTAKSDTGPQKVPVTASPQKAAGRREFTNSQPRHPQRYPISSSPRRVYAGKLMRVRRVDKVSGGTLEL
jgi:hypothetical protein